MATLETLPLELKYNIFSYLLLGKNVRDHSNAPYQMFRFDVSLLRVNKKLGKKALEYFRSSNTFVLIKYFPSDSGEF